MTLHDQQHTQFHAGPELGQKHHYNSRSPKSSGHHTTRPQSRPKHSHDVLYPMVNLVPQLQKPYWKVSSLVVLQSRTQIIRAVTSPLTREILQKVEETLRFRKYFEEQLCQITNYGLMFINHIVAERLKNACWYIYALQLKCKRSKKSDNYVPHHLFIELGLHRKPPTSWFAKKVIKKIKSREDEGLVDELKIIPLHPDFSTDEILKKYVETPLVEKKIEHVTVVLEVKIGEKNKFTESSSIIEDHANIVLTDDDEKYLAKIKQALEKQKESLGRMCIRYIRPAVFASRDLFTDINLPVS